MKRWVKRLGIGLGVCILCFIVFVTIEHFRGKWALQQRLAELRKQGEELGRRFSGREAGEGGDGGVAEVQGGGRARAVGRAKPLQHQSIRMGARTRRGGAGGTIGSFVSETVRCC